MYAFTISRSASQGFGVTSPGETKIVTVSRAICSSSAIARSTRSFTNRVCACRSTGTRGGRRPSEPGKTTYSEVGRTAIDKLIELGREVGTMRGSLRTAREEAREAREGRDEAERRANSLASRVRDLEGKLEMAESNLRTILAAAKGGPRAADNVGDAEMDAILGVLRDRNEEAPRPS